MLLVRVRLTNQSSVIEVETGFGLRGVFQYCVTGTESVTLTSGPGCVLVRISGN